MVLGTDGTTNGSTKTGSKNENGCRHETGTAWGKRKTGDVTEVAGFTGRSRRWKSPRTCRPVLDLSKDSMNLGSERPTD